MSPQTEQEQALPVRPLSPTESGAEVAAHSIDVRAESQAGADAVHVKDNVDAAPTEVEEDKTGTQEQSGEASVAGKGCKRCCRYYTPKYSLLELFLDY